LDPNSDAEPLDTEAFPSFLLDLPSSPLYAG